MAMRILRKYLYLSTVVIIVIASGDRVHADLLLGEYSVAINVTTTINGTTTPFNPASSATFAFGFGGPPNYNDADPIGTFTRDSRIGFDFEIGSFNSAPATEVFDASRPGFADVAGLLVDGVDDPIRFSMIFLANDGSLATVGSVELQQDESVGLSSGSVDYSGHDISEIRLRMDQVRYAWRSSGTNYSISKNVQLNWEVYGAAVPEPSSYGFLAAVGVAWLSRRKRALFA